MEFYRLGWAKDYAAQLILDDALELVAARRFPNVEDALHHLWLLHCEFCTEMGNPLQKVKPFTLNTLSLGGSVSNFPTIVSAIKAWKCKHLCKWISLRTLELAAMPSASAYQKEQASMAHHFLCYIRICDRGDLLLNDLETDRACHHGWRFLRWYQHLATISFQKDRCAYKLRPKLHNFAHHLLELRDTRENPAKHALWAAEDMVGQVKKIGQKCHRVANSKRTVQKRGLFLHLRAMRARKDPRRLGRVLKTKLKN